MDPATITQIVTALSIIAKIVDALGVGGIIGLALAGPVIVVIAVLLLSHLNNRRLSTVVDAYRKDADTRFEQYRKQSEGSLREIRNDSSKRFNEFRTLMTTTVDKYGEALGETRQFYKDNVELVRSWERLAQDFAEIISLNTRTQQKLVDKIETNQFCPAVKEKMRP